jgi:outer membrane receptor protein involved in Fe transport
MDKMSTLGLSLNFRDNNRGTGNTVTNNEYDLSNNLLSNYYTTSNQNDKGYSLDINSNYMLRFKTPQQVLSAEITYSRDKDNEDEENYDTYITPVNPEPNKRNEFSDEIKDAFSGKVDYAHPFSKDIMLETGYKLNYNRRDNDYSVDTFDYNQNRFIRDLNESNRFIFTEQVQGLYGIYTQQLGSFGFSLGGRVEYTHANGELRTTSQSFIKNYIDFFPSASVSQKITKFTEIQLSYSRRINRPRQRQLNPFRSLNGSNSYSEGNPNLNPEFTDAMELNFIQYFPWATITPGVFYRYTKDEISRTKSLLDSVSTLTTFVNLNSSKSFGGELIVSSQPAKFLNINGTFSYYRTDVDASNLEAGQTNGTSTWSARGMGTILLPADFSLQMSYFYTGKRVTSNGIMEPIQAFDAAVKKDLFDKKLSLTLRASDIFNTAKFATNFNDVDFTEYSERVRDSRGLFFNVTYKFGQQEKKQQNKKRKEDNNQNEGEDDFGY